MAFQQMQRKNLLGDIPDNSQIAAQIAQNGLAMSQQGATRGKQLAAQMDAEAMAANQKYLAEEEKRRKQLMQIGLMLATGGVGGEALAGAEAGAAAGEMAAEGEAGEAIANAMAHEAAENAMRTQVAPSAAPMTFTPPDVSQMYGYPYDPRRMYLGGF